ncbi:efflux RND transporter periplasmic adaptor subunit [Variovorax paradoxus]|uniref:Multidrug resistance protein MdtA n=1 Tax=Variovorax paradoxus TaxID=34073 RepID=A0A0H2M8B6_VARPD|nr:efflux RND transporter periplasmic adaptor subunit [Variovorax paradoxus]KLN53295.1 multidrug resistance protein MdtA precursor [Variovorax paradoxus]
MSKIRSLTLAALVASLALAAPARAAPETLNAVTAQPAAAAASSFDGVVEAVRQTVIAAQVSGAVVRLDAKVGDAVKAGQVLLQIDARAADQTAAASDAQVQAARASLEVATREYERQQQLFKKNYISRAALERAESEFKATRAQVAAQGAQAGAARTQSGLHVIRAPYAGVVAEVPVSLGDMAMPGRPLVTVYDPSALRITAAIPQTVAAQMAAGQLPRAELPGLAAQRQWVTPARMQLLPTVDAATHTVQLRADLPAGLDGVVPGMFARLWLPSASEGSSVRPSLSVPLSAIVRRAELTGLYVLDPQGRPLLRQVRLGRVDGDKVEILSGLMPGERVATDPQAAARFRQTTP